MKDDMISRRAAIDALRTEIIKRRLEKDTNDDGLLDEYDAEWVLRQLPPAQPPKEIPKRVLWTGWKGYRDTRYKCPNCEMPVRNDDAYCHRCGQRLMFPKISFTPYIPGQKQDVIVRWEDESE